MASAADKLNNAQLADLSALADGTLDPARREAVRAWVASSPELTALYERELWTVQALTRAAETERAPAGLRARIEAQRPGRTVRARRRLVYGGALATGLAALALALALILPTGAPGGPSVSQAAALALRGVAAPPPRPDSASSGQKLRQAVDDAYFPNWNRQLGWRAIGQRVDQIDGRRAVTVYYAGHRALVAYTIVGAPALATPPARVSRLNGTELRTLSVHGRRVVTWRRDDNTCVLSGSGVPARVLQKLAAWKGA